LSEDMEKNVLSESSGAVEG